MPTMTASDFGTDEGSAGSAQEASIVVFVLLDHHIGSTLLTNFYRSIKFMKLDSNIIINSKISNELIYHTKHDTKLVPSPQLLYRGSRDGFEPINFHSRCDNQGPTLTIIKSSEPYNQIFGGFTTQSWKSSDGYEYISDDLAFLFKIEENSSNQQQQQLLRKFNIKQGMKYNAILNYKLYLSTFGKGHDICIANDCNLNKNSFTNFGYNYELPPSNNVGDEEYKYGSEKVNNYLAGSYSFKVLEIEVFKITTSTTTTTIIQ